jgi:hypothetical protein
MVRSPGEDRPQLKHAGDENQRQEDKDHNCCRRPHPPSVPPTSHLPPRAQRACINDEAPGARGLRLGE